MRRTDLPLLATDRDKEKGRGWIMDPRKLDPVCALEKKNCSVLEKNSEMNYGAQGRLQASIVY